MHGLFAALIKFISTHASICVILGASVLSFEVAWIWSRGNDNN